MSKATQYFKIASPTLIVFFLLHHLVMGFGPQLNTTAPTGVVVGSESTLHLHGKHLTKARTLLFYKKGLSVGKPTVHNDKHISFPLKVAPDCPIGEHPVRLHCDNGTSYQRIVWVNPLPIIDESKEANDSPDQAQELQLNTSARGQIKREDRDYYKVMLKKGQRFSAELVAMRLGRKFFDAHLSLLGPDQRVIASSDDSPLTKQDPYISLIAAHDGYHYLSIREASYEGSDQSHYLLNVGEFLRPLAVFPPAAPKNVATKFRFILDGEQSHSQSISPEEPWVFAETQGRTAPTPVPIILSDLPSQNEVEPNNNAKNTQSAMGIPCAFHGIISEPGDVDWFKFRGKKGQEIRISAIARTLGSALDAKIDLRNGKSKWIAGNDDSNHPDSKIDFKLPADGDYQLSIRDHLGNGSASASYRIQVKPRVPALKCSINRDDRNDSQKSKVLNIPRGSMLAYRLNLTREKNSATFIPRAAKLPAGVTLHPVAADKSLTSIPLLFSASAKAPISAGLYPMKLVSEDKKISAPVTETIEHIRINNQGVFHSFTSDKLTICVTEEAPFSLELLAPQATAVQNGSITLEAKITRSEGFDEEVTLFFPWLPPGITGSSTQKIPKGKNSCHYTLAVNGSCKSRKWPICLSARANTKQGNILISSAFVELDIQPPYLSTTLDMAATTQGTDTQIVCKIEHHNSFAGKAELSLHGLPDGLTASPVKIDSKSKQVSIPIKVAPDARVANYNNLFCHIKVPSSTGTIPHNSGQGGTLRIDPKPKQTTAKKVDPAPSKSPPKKNLSRLEALRQQLTP